MTTVRSYFKNFYLNQSYQQLFPFIMYAEYFNNGMPGSICSMIAEDIYSNFLNSNVFPDLVPNYNCITKPSEIKEKYRLYGNGQYIACKIAYEDSEHSSLGSYDINKKYSTLQSPLDLYANGDTIDLDMHSAYISTTRHPKINENAWTYGYDIVINEILTKNNTRRSFKKTDNFRLPLTFYLEFYIMNSAAKTPYITNKLCIFQNINDFIINNCDVKKCKLSDVRPTEHFYLLDVSTKIDTNKDKNKTLYSNNKNFPFYEINPNLDFYQINDIRPFTNKFIESLTLKLMCSGGSI